MKFEKRRTIVFAIATAVLLTATGCSGGLLVEGEALVAGAQTPARSTSAWLSPSPEAVLQPALT